ALFYEAVQPCGNRFNRNGIDNDVRRFRFAEKAIGELEKQRVFYTKAGGSSWMHRDIRVALHTMLDRVPWKKHDRLYWHSQSVGRTHFWIGDWYEKAFYSTGFSKPVFEALHHYFQAARLARFALPKGLTETDHKDVQSHRFLLVRSALNAMTKLLLVARPFLKLWMANLHGFPMFDFSRNKGKESYAHLNDWLWPESDPEMLRMNPEQQVQLGGAFKLLCSVVENTQRAIRNEADIQIAPEITSGNLGLVTAGIEVQQQLDSLLSHVYKNANEWNFASQELIACLATVFGNSVPKILEAYEVCLPIGKTPASITKAGHARNKGQVVTALGERLEKLPALMSIVDAIAYAQMRRAKFRGHIVLKHEQEQAWRREDVRGEWLRVTRICNLGIDWCKHLPPDALRLDLELRVRLHSYYAVALANLDRFYEAHRHLTEALAIQSKHLWASPRIEQAKLSLRRAEVVLTEAHRVGHVLRLFAKECNIPEIERTGTFSKSGKTFLQCLHDNGMCDHLNDTEDPEKGLFRIEWHQSVRECLVVGNDNPAVVLGMLRRLLAAMLDDAWFAIENAEKALSGQSQSSLWWGRIALMKLRACGYQLNLWTRGIQRSGGKKLSSPHLKMLAYRHRRINPQGIWRLFETARLNDRHADPSMKYREFRLVRYVAICLRVFAHCKDETDFVYERIEELYDEYCRSDDAEKKRIKLTPELKRILANARESVSEAWIAVQRP
ncbi:MAG TPA: hypothetical protein VFG14_19675, partial [Chthoniobacteraceae bacterium]|nr:hypothetical protein [Chthoniobacteraceae bacterium]